MRAVRRGCGPIVFFALSAWASAASPLTPEDLVEATYRETATAGPLNQEGFLLNLPEVISLDYQSAGGSQAVTSLIASPVGPQGDVQYSVNRVFGDGVGAGFSASGFVDILYGIAIVPLVPDAPDEPVQTLISVEAFLSLTETGANTTSPSVNSLGSAMVRIDGFSFPGSPSGTFNIEVAIDPDHPETPSALEVNRTFMGQFTPNTQIGVQKQVSIGATARRPDVLYEGIGVIDPQFAIDPSFMVDYHGVPTPASQLYEIIYSVGVVPIVPEPGSLGLVMTTAGLLVIRKRPSNWCARRSTRIAMCQEHYSPTTRA